MILIKYHHNTNALVFYEDGNAFWEITKKADAWSFVGNLFFGLLPGRVKVEGREITDLENTLLEVARFIAGRP